MLSLFMSKTWIFLRKLSSLKRFIKRNFDPFLLSVGSISIFTVLIDGFYTLRTQETQPEIIVDTFA